MCLQRVILLFCYFNGYSLGADAKSLVENGRIQSQNHQFVYNEGIKVQALTQTISD